MLSGVKTGKKKRKRPASAGASAPGSSRPAAASSAPASASSSKKSANLAAAEELRRSLGLVGGGGESGSGSGGRGGGSDNVAGAWDDLERRGRIRVLDGDSAPSDNADDADADGRAEGGPVVLTSSAVSSAPLSREDFRRGARRGKLSRHAARTSAAEAGGETTVEQMAAEERSSSHRGMDESFARNVARLGSRYKGAEFAGGSRSGADEEDYGGDVGGADMSMFSSGSERLTDAERAKRERARQIATHDRQSAIAAKCWWWTSSPSFRRHMLLALGDHVSMVLCPSHLSLVEHQAILVPIRQGESFASCEEEVWDEVSRFQSSLRRMWAKRGKGVVFMETVLPHKGFWQARMECVPVPRRVEGDAPIYFKSALTEQAEEWGTHTKILPTRGKGLRRTVPKNFPYFHVEWSPGDGYAQIIESTSFPRDFGLDTVAGMMGMDPMKFSRKRKAADEDRGAVLKFVEMWKKFDWTLELDGGGDGDGGGEAGRNSMGGGGNSK